MTVRTVVGFTFAVFESGFAIWAAAVLHLGALGLGLTLGYVGVIQVIIQLGLIGPLTRRFADAQLIVGASSLAAVSLLAWGLVPNLWALIAIMPFLSLGMAVTNTILGSALTKAVNPDEIGGIIGLSTSIGSATRIPAPTVAGLLIQFVGPWAPGVIVGALTAAVVPFAWVRLVRRPDAPLPSRNGEIPSSRPEEAVVPGL